ncbi:MAG: glycosyltransferase family 39 protein [Coriobacteriales bacterium]
MSKEAKKFNYTVVTIAIIFTIILQISLFCKQYCNVWFDEAFTLVQVQKPFKDMWTSLVGDVHPPLYYLICTLAKQIFGVKYRIFKFLSALPIMIMHIWISLLIMKEPEFRNDRKTGILLSIFILATTVTDVFLFMSTEIRMYSWAMLFVTMSGVYAYKVYKTHSISDSILFTGMSVAAALTHYYALFMEVYIYFMLLCFIIARNRKFLKQFGIIVLCTIASYAWWLPVGYKQFTGVKANYWITFKFADITSFFSQLINYDFKLEIIFFAFLLGEAIYFLYVSRQATDLNKERIVVGILFMSVVIFTIILGLVLDVTIRPMFIFRYCMPAMGLFWLGIIVIISQLPNHKKLFSILLVAMIIFTGMNRYPIRMQNEYETGSYDSVTYIQKYSNRSDILTSNIPQLGMVLTFHFPDQTRQNMSDIDFSKTSGTYWYFEDQKNKIDKTYIKNAGFKVEKVRSGNFDNTYYYNLFKISK